MTTNINGQLNRKDFFNDKDFFGGLVKIGIPIALQQLLYAVFAVIDTAMIAQLGAASTAGVGAATRVFFLMLVICFGLSAATSALVAQYWGIKDFYNIRRTTGLSLSVALGLGAVFTVVVGLMPETIVGFFTTDAMMIQEGTAYLRMLSTGFMIWCFNFIFATALKSTECVRIPLFASILTILSNIFLNWVFIFGNLGAPKMGVAGAALGTVISYAIQMVILITAVTIKKHGLTRKIKEYFAWTRDFSKKFFKIMTPAFLNEIIWGLGTMVYALVLGHYGSVSYGAYTIYMTVEGMFFTFFIGLAGASGVLIGKELGKGDKARSWHHAVRTVVLTPLIAAVLGIIMVILRYPVLNLMQIPDRNLLDLSAKLLVFYAIASPIRVIPFVTIIGIFRAGGDTLSAFWIDTLNVWLVGVPLTLIAGVWLKLPFEWVFLATFTEDVFKSVFCIAVFVKRKWLNQLTSDSAVFTEGVAQVD